MGPRPTEITLEASDGIQLAGQSWKVHPTTSNPDIKNNGSDQLHILLLHGWMDNCASFHWLAPALISHLDAAMADNDNSDSNTQENTQSSSPPSKKRFQHVHVVALDLPGHGLSSHHSQDAPPTVRSEYLFYIAEAIRQLKWAPTKQQPQKFVVMGHSMSAGVALLYAAAFPEQVRQLVLLDSTGQVLTGGKDKTASQHLRNFVTSRQSDGPFLLQPESRFYYPSLEMAVQARCRSVKMFPGNQYISELAAKELVQRGIIKDDNGKFRFRHDPRLQWNSLQYYSVGQLEELYRDIKCPTAVLLGQDGWPVDKESKMRVEEFLKPVVLKTLPGSHHLHADPDAADAVINEIVSFLQQTSP